MVGNCGVSVSVFTSTGKGLTHWWHNLQAYKQWTWCIHACQTCLETTRLLTCTDQRSSFSHNKATKLWPAVRDMMYSWHCLYTSYTHKRHILVKPITCTSYTQTSHSTFWLNRLSRLSYITYMSYTHKRHILVKPFIIRYMQLFRIPEIYTVQQNIHCTTTNATYTKNSLRLPGKFVYTHSPECIYNDK